MRIVSCSRDEQRESSEGGGSGCDGAAAQNNFATFHKIIWDEQFKIISQNNFGRALQNYFTKLFWTNSLKLFHKIILDDQFKIILQIILDELFKIISQNNSGRAVQNNGGEVGYIFSHKPHSLSRTRKDILEFLVYQI